MTQELLSALGHVNSRRGVVLAIVYAVLSALPSTPTYWGVPVGVVFALLLLWGYKKKLPFQNALTIGITVVMAITLVWAHAILLAEDHFGQPACMVAAMLVFCVPVLRPWIVVLGVLLVAACMVALHFLFAPAFPDPTPKVVIASLLVVVLGIYIGIQNYRSFMFSFKEREKNENLKARLAESYATIRDLREQFDHASRTDAVTGMVNRQGSKQGLVNLWREALDQSQLAFALFGVDFLGPYNTRFGFVEGDHLLQKVADKLQKSFRASSDSVSRFVGDKFLVVFNTSHYRALDLADRARAGIEELHIDAASAEVSPFVTVSAGVCMVLPQMNIAIDQVIQAADEALDKAKLNGRNQISVVDYGS
jgi:diguanylate cyclase (GGDEF)-like protein